MPDQQKEKTPELVEQPTSAPSLIGEVIAERYRIVSELGEGGMGIVYKAKHLNLPREVAIKMLSESLRADEAARVRFANEAHAASLLSHPNIVSVHDYGFTKSDGRPYLVMDYAEGTSLSQLLKERGRLPPAMAVDVMRDIARGVGHAHAKGVIHRDLKPSNILVGSNESGPRNARVLDFGIAKVKDSAAAVTKTGDVFGTVMYMSPEQCNGQKLDARSDVYSLGCMLFECLTGQPPYKGDSAIGIAVQHMQNPIPTAEIPGASQSLVDSLNFVIRKAMAKEPEKRFQTADEFAGQLDLIAQGVMPKAQGNKTPPMLKLSAAVFVALVLLVAICELAINKPQGQLPVLSNQQIPAPAALTAPLKAIKDIETKYGVDDPRLIPLLMQYADSLENQPDRLAERIEVEERAVALMKKHDAEKSFDYAVALLKLGGMHHGNHEILVARSLYKEAMAVENTVGADGLLKAVTAEQYANTYFHSGDYKTGLKLLQETKLQYEKIGKQDHLNYATTLSELSACNLRLGNEDKALTLFYQAAEHKALPKGVLANIIKYHFEPVLQEQGKTELLEKLRKIAAESS